MAASKKRRSPKRKKTKQGPPSQKTIGSNAPPESTGYEAAYFKSLIDSGADVVVVLRTGETLRGRVRYYDRDVFSLGPADNGPNLFLRKSSVRYLYEA